MIERRKIKSFTTFSFFFSFALLIFSPQWVLPVLSKMQWSSYHCHISSSSSRHIWENAILPLVFSHIPAFFFFLTASQTNSVCVCLCVCVHLPCLPTTQTLVCFEENRMNFNLKAAGALFSRAKQVFKNIGKKLILKNNK